MRKRIGMRIGPRDPKVGRLMLAEQRQQVDELDTVLAGRSLHQIGDESELIILNVMELRQIGDDQGDAIGLAILSQALNSGLGREPAGSAASIVETEVIVLPRLARRKLSQQGV